MTEVRTAIKMARQNYEILKSKVAIANMKKYSLYELYKRIRGHNFNGELFDVNYGNICATITCRNGAIKLVNSVEIWNKEEILFDDYKFEE